MAWIWDALSWKGTIGTRSPSGQPWKKSGPMFSKTSTSKPQSIHFCLPRHQIGVINSYFSCNELFQIFFLCLEHGFSIFDYTFRLKLQGDKRENWWDYVWDFPDPFFACDLPGCAIAPSSGKENRSCFGPWTQVRPLTQFFSCLRLVKYHWDLYSHLLNTSQGRDNSQGWVIVVNQGLNSGQGWEKGKT